MSEFMNIPLNQISVKENYRKHFNDKSLGELKESGARMRPKFFPWALSLVLFGADLWRKNR